MRVRVHLFGDLMRFLPRGQGVLDLEVEDGATTASILERIGIHPGEVWLVRANREVVAEDQPLHEGDDLEIFEPVGGGAGPRTGENGELSAEGY